jgi:hypothetical protein
MFFDTKGNKMDSRLKEAYHLLYDQGDFISKYRCIVDSLFIDYSHQNIGLQMADFCAGVFNGTLRGFEQSKKTFKNIIWQKVRRKNKNVFGYGISEVPKRTENREILKRLIEDIQE